MRKRSRRYLLWLCYAGFAFAFLALVSRNYVSRIAAERIGSSVLSTSVTIQAIYLGWGTIQVRGITVMEPNIDDAPQVQVDYVDVTTSVIAGLSSGVWVERLFVSDPQLHVRFDDEGTLQSVFPTSQGSGGGDAKIPLASLLVQRARLIVHHGDREFAAIDGANLVAKFADKIDIRGRVDQVMNGNVAFQTLVDATTFAGDSLVQVDGCRFDVESFPGNLMPSVIRDQGVGCDIAARIKVHHPAGVTDPRLHPAQIRVLIENLASSDFGNVFDRMAVTVQTNDDGLAVAVDADPLSGQAALRLTSDSFSPPLQVDVAGDVRGCNLGPILNRFVPDVDANATISLTTRSQINWDGEIVSFHNTVHSVA
ncbi:MAG: hypothetical protein KDB00_28185, partial [Planctomycetales bacterium]|nr:hypothetical protein [Planctomycetales bacterium]